MGKCWWPETIHPDISSKSNEPSLYSQRCHGEFSDLTMGPRFCCLDSIRLSLALCPRVTFLGTLNGYHFRTSPSGFIYWKTATLPHHRAEKGTTFFKYGPIPASFRVYSLLSLFTTSITTDVRRSLDTSAPFWQGMSSLPGLTQQREGVLGRCHCWCLTIYKTGVDYHGSDSCGYDVQ